MVTYKRRDLSGRDKTTPFAFSAVKGKHRSREEGLRLWTHFTATG